MTKGTLKNKTTGDTLTVEGAWKTTSFGLEYWAAQVVGENGTSHLFRQDWWDFTEDKPSPAEQYKALEPGTIFVINKPDSAYKYLKISDDKYYSVTYGRVNPVKPNEFHADLYVVEEQ